MFSWWSAGCSIWMAAYRNDHRDLWICSFIQVGNKYCHVKIIWYFMPANFDTLYLTCSLFNIRFVMATHIRLLCFSEYFSADTQSMALVMIFVSQVNGKSSIGVGKLLQSTGVVFYASVLCLLFVGVVVFELTARVFFSVEVIMTHILYIPPYFVSGDNPLYFCQHV